MTDHTPLLDRLTARAGQLYSLPSVAMKILELTADPMVDARAVKQCIEKDPALTSKVLRVVNSSLFGLSREVSDLNQALALLGTKPLKLLVLGFSLPSGMFLGVEAKTLAWYWRHTLTKAVASRELSQSVWKSPGDEAFIAGLLQDLGILLLLQQLGEPYARFLDKALTNGLDLAAMEIEAMGFSHTQLSARLLAKWGLPGSLIEAIGCGTAGPCSNLAQVLHLSELLARLLADGQPKVLGELLEAGRGYRRITEAQVESLVTDLGEKVQQLAAVLSLQLPGGMEYRDVLAEAQRQLACVASQAAGDLLRSGQGGTWSAEEELLLGELQELAEAVSRICPRIAEESSRHRAPPSDGRCAGPEVTPPSPIAWPAHRPGEPGARSRLPSAVLQRAPQTEQAMSDPGLVGRLNLAVAACRQARCPLSLLLVDLARSDELLTSLGVDGFEALRRVVEAICRRVDHPRTICTAFGETGFALILPDCERRQATRIGDELLRSVQRLAPQQNEPSRPIGLAVGAATLSLPPKNFTAQDLLAGAERCLYGSHASGGGVVKSIEIY